MKIFHKLRESESGATLVEYGVALILAIVLGGSGLVSLSSQVTDNMNDVEGTMISRSSN